jgi:hypothetical protein
VGGSGFRIAAGAAAQARAKRPRSREASWARAPNSPSQGEDRERPNSLAHRRILHTVIRYADHCTSYPVDMHKREPVPCCAWSTLDSKPRPWLTWTIPTYYGAYCRRCKHSARLSLTKLRAHLGDTFPLVKIRDRLRCERCSSRQIVITFLAPDQRTGNLVPLFGEKPR